MPGALAFAGGTTVIGTVSDVYDTTSRVELFSAPGESYQALLQDGTPISLSGEGAGSMSGEVPAGTTVTTGEAVSLPGISSAFAGSVSHVYQQSGAFVYHGVRAAAGRFVFVAICRSADAVSKP